MTLFLFALPVRVVAGLRAMTTPAAVGWAACLGGLDPEALLTMVAAT